MNDIYPGFCNRDILLQNGIYHIAPMVGVAYTPIIVEERLGLFL
jgi:hypothetical protein